MTQDTPNRDRKTDAWIDHALGENSSRERRRLERRLRDEPEAAADFAGVRATIDEVRAVPGIEPSADLRDRTLRSFRAWRATLDHAAEEDRPLRWREIPGFLVAYARFRARTSPGFRALSLATVLHAILFFIIAGITVVTLNREGARTEIRFNADGSTDSLMDESLAIESILPKSDSFPSPAKPELRELWDEPEPATRVEDATDPRRLWSELTDREDRLLIGRWILFARYSGERRDNLLQLYGGTEETEEAIERALRWLASRQLESGAWDVEAFGGDPRYESGTTSLAILAFLGGGHSTIQGEYRDTVARGIDFLLRSRGNDGLFGGAATAAPTYLYNHVLASRALLECYLMGIGSEDLRDAIASATATLVALQNPDGGWRYAERGTSSSDASVTSWALEAVGLAERSGVTGSGRYGESIDRARAFLNAVTNQDGEVKYRMEDTVISGESLARTAGESLARTAGESLARTAGAFLALDAHRPRAEALSAEGVRRRNALMKFLAADPFGSKDPVELFLFTDAVFQIGGEAWQRWNPRLQELLLGRQMEDGSWAPTGKYAANGGTVASTALAALALEVYYRFPRRAGE